MDGLDPFYDWDANGDINADSLFNLFEYKHNLSIQDSDTDHDGIDDGAELHYWNTTRGLPLSTALEYARNPDVDNDSIPDGKEIRGYRVKIIVGWKDDGTPVSEMQNVSREEMDPLVPYGYEVGNETVWTDTDGDGIPDVVEAMLSNTSRFLDFYNFTHDKKNNATGLWDDYAWSIAYYYSIKLHEEWDDVYHNLESNPVYWIRYYNAAEVSNPSWVDNATKYIQSQYNPLIVENVAPVILKFSVEFHYYVVTAEFGVHAMVADAGEVEKVKILDSDFGQSAEWTVNTRMAEINHTFWASPWGANLGANISVKAWDVRENRVVINKTILGPVGQTLELLWSMLPAWLRRALVSAAQAVVQAVNVIVQYILHKISEGFDTALGKYMDSLILYATAWVIEFASEESSANNSYERALIAGEMFKKLIASEFTTIILLMVKGISLLFMALAPYQVILMGILLVVGILFENYILEKTTHGKLDLTKVITHIPSLQELQGFYPNPENEEQYKWNESAMFILYMMMFFMGTLFMYGGVGRISGPDILFWLSLVGLLISGVIFGVLSTYSNVSDENMKWPSLLILIMDIVFIFGGLFSIPEELENGILYLIGFIFFVTGWFCELYIYLNKYGR